MVVNRNIELVQKYPRGSRGSPAKGVVWEDRSEGSNPSFCAKRQIPKGTCLFCYINQVMCQADCMWCNKNVDLLAFMTILIMIDLALILC